MKIKSIVVIFITLFIAVGTALGQTAYKNKQQDLMAQFLRDVWNRYPAFLIGNDLSHEDARALITGSYSERRLRQLGRQVDIIATVAVVNRHSPAGEAILIMYDKANDDYYRKARPLMNAAEKAEEKAKEQAAAEKQRKEQEERDRVARQQRENAERERQQRLEYGRIAGKYGSYIAALSNSRYNQRIDYYDSIQRDFRNVRVVKDQFETQAEFEARRDKFFRDSTEFYFVRIFEKYYNMIKNNRTGLTMGQFNAERGGFSIASISTPPFDRNRSASWNDVGFMAVDRDKARELSKYVGKDLLQEREFKAIFDNFVFGFVDFSLRIKSARFGDMEVKFPQNANVEEFKFYGNELWRDNPHAANLVFGISDLLELQRIRAEVQQKLNEERRIWAENFPTRIQRLSIMRANGSVVVLSVGEDMPIRFSGVSSINKINLHNNGGNLSINGQNIFVADLSSFGKIKSIRRVAPIKPEWYGAFEAEGVPVREKAARAPRTRGQVAEPAPQQQQTRAVEPQPQQEQIFAEPEPEPQVMPTTTEEAAELIQEEQIVCEEPQTTPVRAQAQPQPERTPRPERPAKPAKTQSGDNDFMFSVRPEFLAQTAVMSIGASIEVGVIKANGLYISGDLSGGAIYLGAGGNIGYCFNKDGFAKNVLGVSVGYKNSLLFSEFTDDFGNVVAFGHIGQNVGIGGVFHKLMLGERNNFDITNKLLFGFRNNPHSDWNDNGGVDIWWESGFNAAYSLSVGYTLKRPRN